jgi:predicted Zn-dependent protease
VSGASHRGTAHGGGHIAHVTRLPARRGGYGGGDYLGELGGITRWEPGKNIRVYVAPGRSSFKSIVANAMNQWSHASGGAFHWSLVGDPGSADYTISWSGTQHEVSTGTEAGLTTTDTMPNDDGSETIAKAHTRILTRLDGYPLPDREIAETVLHEIGHGLGLDGHSSNPRDIMFYAAAQGQGGLTARDMNTLQKLYRQ